MPVNNPVAVTFSTTVQRMNGQSVELPISATEPLFIVGPNGAGKSGLILMLYRQNPEAVRVSAHRQTSIETNLVPFSPQDKKTNEINVKSQDRQASARYLEWNASVRSGLVIADLIEADNTISRKIRAALKSEDDDLAKKLAKELPPLDTINELLAGSGIPIALSILEDSSIVASRRGGRPYSIAALSDGERAALLIAGQILTAKENALILIDEPERHLHKSIVVPLLQQLFSRRVDCSFVVSTHELDLPLQYDGARTILVRDSRSENDDVKFWDIDILEPGSEVDDDTKISIMGARRKILFVEGKPNSLDQPLYELLFPGVSIFARQTCFDVEHAVTSLRDAASITWVQGYGIVDQDQLSDEKKASLATQGIFALSLYSVEALYYGPSVVNELANIQSRVLGGDPQSMVDKAWIDFLEIIAQNVDRLAARMTEQAVKDRASLEMLDWKKIQAGQNLTINIDAQELYQLEKDRLQAWLKAGDVGSIITRYPIRETPGLGAIVAALQFKGRPQFEAAVRKMVADNAELKAAMLENFGGLPTALAE